jgi:hypothetical protein
MEKRINSALETGNLSRIRKLLSLKYSSTLNNPTDKILEELVPYLETAAFNGNFEVAKYFIDMGCVRLCYSYGGPRCDVAFRHAAKNGHIDIVKYFIENEYDLRRDCRYLTLWSVMCNQQIEVAQYFVSLGYGYEIISERDYFISSVCYDKLKYADYLISLGHDYQKSFGQNIFFRGYLCKHPDSVKYLIKLGYDISKDDYIALRSCEMVKDVLHYMLSSLSKRNLYTFSKKCNSYDSITKVSSSRTKSSNNLLKCPVLKFILKPTSLHTQLMLIE